MVKEKEGRRERKADLMEQTPTFEVGWVCLWL